MRPFSPRAFKRRAYVVVKAACALGLVLFTAFATAAAPSDSERALEQRVKAAFLYRFTEFATWPDSAFTRAEAPFVIAVVGRDGVAEELRNITTGRAVAGHAIEVKRVAEGEAVPAAHMVFIGDGERARLRELIRAAPRSALVVTESEGALALGSVINFVIAEGRVRFDIALDAAEKRGVRLSSRLLAVAHTVRGGNP